MFGKKLNERDELLKEITIENEERESLKAAFAELEEIDKEIVDDHKVIELLDEKIIFCYEKLYEVLDKLNQLREKENIDASEIMIIEELHDSITQQAEGLTKYLDKIKEDTEKEQKGILALKKHIDKITSDLEKNKTELKKFQEILEK